MIKTIHHYNGKLYWLSQKNLDGQKLIPHIPNNYLTQNKYEDNKTTRLCFAPTIEKCLMAISENLTNKIFYVHEPINTINIVYKPDKNDVPDSIITEELWVKHSVRIKKTRKIFVIGPKETDGMKYQYGDKEAKLYEWNYIILE